jgi:hypothetical protein
MAVSKSLMGQEQTHAPHQGLAHRLCRRRIPSIFVTLEQPAAAPCPKSAAARVAIRWPAARPL